MFRVNLSHTPLDGVAGTIEFLQGLSSVPVCLDTEGPQVRCGRVRDNVMLGRGTTVRLLASDILGSEEALTLRPASVFRGLQPGHTVGIDFDGALLRITSVAAERAEALVIEPGAIGSNKAVLVEPTPELSSFTEKDIAAIALGVERGIRHFALSFAGCAEDVTRLRTMVAPDSVVIAKIESRAGVRNLESIMAVSDAILIDRGDLSRQIPIEHVPMYQKHIIRSACARNVPVLVATNLLDSMIARRRPTAAEANDIINTLADGANGLVLAAETAIGRNPVQVVDMVVRLLDAFDHFTVRHPTLVLDQIAQQVA